MQCSALNATKEPGHGFSACLPEEGSVYPASQLNFPQCSFIEGLALRQIWRCKDKNSFYPQTVSILWQSDGRSSHGLTELSVLNRVCTRQ